MFTQHTDDGYLPAVPGITRKTLVHGDKTLMTEFRLQEGSVLPRHAHPHEQTGYLVSGRLRLTIGDEAFDVQPGDSWCIPGDVAHEAVALAGSVAVEVFAPVRDDYLEARAARGSREAYDAALAKVPDVEPEEYDKL
jgi:quercetin dioxygenase-like cupin family protein